MTRTEQNIRKNHVKATRKAKIVRLNDLRAIQSQPTASHVCSTGCIVPFVSKCPLKH